MVRRGKSSQNFLISMRGTSFSFLVCTTMIRSHIKRQGLKDGQDKRYNEEGFFFRQSLIL